MQLKIVVEQNVKIIIATYFYITTHEITHWDSIY